MSLLSRSILLPSSLALVVIVLLLRQPVGNVLGNQHNRLLQSSSSSLPANSSPPTCEVPKPIDLQVPPTLVASYPGSGAKLTWKLIRAITGLYTGDDFDHNGRVARGTAVAVKTHYPSHASEEVFQSGKLGTIHQAILLLRNPLHALPSFHNFLYEKQRGLRNHSTRAPVDAWVAWRNEHFDEELALWTEHVRWWMANFNREGYTFKLLVFEYLTSSTEGTKELSGLFDFFANTHTSIQSNMIPQEQIPCIWDMLVRGTVPGEKERRKSLRSGPAEYPFTSSQLTAMVQSIQNLKLQFGGSYPPLGDAMDYYLAELEQLRARILNDFSIA